jgi:predicted ATPase
MAKLLVDAGITASAEPAPLHPAEGQVGRPLLAEALEAVYATGEHWFEAELHRLKAELVRSASADRATAERCFQRGMALARAQNAKLWELHAATSLARLWAELSQILPASVRRAIGIWAAS